MVEKDEDNEADAGPDLEAHGHGGREVGDGAGAGRRVRHHRRGHHVHLEGGFSREQQ